MGSGSSRASRSEVALKFHTRSEKFQKSTVELWNCGTTGLTRGGYQRVHQIIYQYLLLEAPRAFSAA